ncbi:Flp pilus assembly protein, ATPase CpaF(Type II secretion system protein E,108-384) [Magnetospirillum sp. XM-1]|uniref:CpaF family protein n=1 Tax=Magnetospirillum sp. XM-1 TaxID=1663591 RepID=UPI00073DE431|nr:CpaF family protein [Magnetospirillum sp. XM-1]CUW38431.1 Flp pilus assembly protein, ATPase CpaF(Type II secretion system protein E,108-384) [Magnetospirillum sp. XM-1]
MFGRRSAPPDPKAQPVREAAKPAAIPAPAAAARGAEMDQRLSDIKIAIFNDLIDSVDPTELGNLEPAQVREEISDIVAEIISMRNLVISAAEQQVVINDICNDVLGLGPLEPLIARDDIADIMVNGADKVYIETEGRIELTDIKFRDNAQLMNICQRIVAAVGRRVDESSPICDARLADGSRVNVIVPPLAIDGPTLTIRKFKREKLTLEKLVEFGSLSAPAARVLQIASAVRCNILISGGTGSGKTTLLNCMTRYIDQTERIVTCEDAAELQLQQPHVVRLETRPPNLEGAGAITMRDLVKNCLRMRPERIIVGEVRGPEAFDLLQAMNTGHDGSMGTIHANTPRDALSRVENMVAMGGYNLPAKAVREQIASAVNIIVQASRLRDGSRKITHVTEVVGMEGEIITLQDLFVFEFEGEDSRGRILGRHRPTGLRPAFWDRARYYGLERDLAEALGESHA